MLSEGVLGFRINVLGSGLEALGSGHTVFLFLGESQTYVGLKFIMDQCCSLKRVMGFVFTVLDSLPIWESWLDVLGSWFWVHCIVLVSREEGNCVALESLMVSQSFSESVSFSFECSWFSSDRGGAVFWARGS